MIASYLSGDVQRRRRQLVPLLLVLLLVGGERDPGLLLELDRARFELVVRDLRARDDGPQLRVSLGSPAFETPTGEFPLRVVIRNPRWQPGPAARAAGATPEPSSATGPLGVAKIPFAGGGAISLHGGGHPRLLGKPVSLGCVRTVDADLLVLIGWLEERDALAPARTRAGELHQAFRRPARLRVH